MHFVLQTPSLQHLSGVTIVTHLWNKREYLIQIARASRPARPRGSCMGVEFENKEWVWFKGAVKKKVLAFQVPQRFTEQLGNLVIPIGWEVLKWCECHYVDEYLFTEHLLPPQLCWTMHGNVDYTKTAQLVQKNEGLNNERRYILACINCLEDEARELIEFIPEERKQELINTVSLVRSREKMEHRQGLILFFTCTLSGKQDQLRQFFSQLGDMRVDESIHQYLFMQSIISGSPAICQYFFEKLNGRDREQVLTSSGKKILSICQSSPICNLMYYLSLMKGEQHNISMVVEKCTTELLLCLLRWPMQSLFMDCAKRGYSFMELSSCKQVFNHILATYSFQDCNYSHLFWECWRLTPAEYRRQLLSIDWFLRSCFKTKEEEILKLLLNEAPSYLIRETFYDLGLHSKIKAVVLDERVISDAALIECKEIAALNSSNDKEDKEKRLRSEHISQLVDDVIKSRMERK